LIRLGGEEVTDSEQVENMGTEIEQRFSKEMRFAHLFADLTPGQYALVIDANRTGAFVLDVCLSVTETKR